ncbi:MAG: hypothetical protein ABT940_15165, partial [Alphaproteobacteria bacterium]
PSRARRRRKQGHRQNIRPYYPPRKDMLSLDGGRTYYVHPETMRVFREATENHVAKTLDGKMFNAFNGISF